MKNNSKTTSFRRAFTLVELLVAMTITLIIVSLTIVITGQAVDSWQTARVEIRAASQAKVMLNSLARDLESLVIRTGNNNNQWLAATSEETNVGPDGQPSPNASRVTFYTSASDRYNGNAGSQQKLDPNTANADADQGGDVSVVSYLLDFADPVFGDQSGSFSTFVLYRKLMDPDETYNNFTTSADLEAAFDAVSGGANELEDLMCENVYEFTMTFVVDHKDNEGNPTITYIPVLQNGGGDTSGSSFAINGTGLSLNGNTRSVLASGRVAAIELSITVLSDAGVEILRRRQFSNEIQKAQFIEENGSRFSKSVLIPGG